MEVASLGCKHRRGSFERRWLSPYAEFGETRCGYDALAIGYHFALHSPAQLRELWKFDKDRLREYLNMLAIKGFLLPVELDASRKGYHAISYEGYFGLRGSIRYVKSVQGFGTDEKGKRLVSNQVVGQWAGMGRHILIDVGEAAAVAMGLPEEDRVRYPLAVEVAYGATPWCGLEPVGQVRIRRVEEPFARGLDPDNAAETNLLATISFDADGKPVIGISPKNTAFWDYTILGSRNLRDWAVRSDGDQFFKVSVSPK